MNVNTTIIDIEKLVSEISDLVSLPEIYLKIRELMDDPNSCLDDFAVVASTDPALTASILKIVNSAFYGFAGQIANLNRAINMIGIGQLHDLVLSLSAVNSLNLPNDIEKLAVFWQRSIYCGVLARLFAERYKMQDTENLFVIGLLHEIGRLILFLKYPEQSRLAISLSQKENISLSKAENIIFGTNYSQIGHALMADWNLPLKFQHIIQHHTEPEEATEFQLETTILHVAHMIAINQYPGANNYHHPINQEALSLFNTSEEQITMLCEQANEISLEMEKMILGR